MRAIAVSHGSTKPQTFYGHVKKEKERSAYKIKALVPLKIDSSESFLMQLFSSITKMAQRFHSSGLLKDIFSKNQL